MRENKMATAEQLKSLIRAHFSDDSERFYSIALQVAAHEARQGHEATAYDIKEIIDKERKRNFKSLIKFPQELNGLVFKEKSDVPLSFMVLSEDIEKRINRIISEYRHQNKLKAHGLNHRRKILLIGPPGVGKTMTAKVLANEIKLPLFTVQVDRLVTKFMGETSAKLRQIFDLIEKEHGIYLFDEFDAIGGKRSKDNDVGEMRRVLNSFLQFIEQDSSDSLIIGATNNPDLLDYALYRRFDDIIYYSNPQSNSRKDLIKNMLGTFSGAKLVWAKILKESDGLSHADLTNACRDSIKEIILSNNKKVNSELLLKNIRERKKAHRDIS